MKLEMSEEQVMIRNMIREFAEKEIAPLAAELDEKEIYPAETLKKLAALGILGTIIPTEYGGAGLDNVTYAMVIEEISRKCASTGVVTSVHNSLTAWPIIKYGSEEQKKKYLPILASGEKIGAFGGTEANAGAEMEERLNTTAERTAIRIQFVLPSAPAMVLLTAPAAVGSMAALPASELLRRSWCSPQRFNMGLALSRR